MAIPKSHIYREVFLPKNCLQRPLLFQSRTITEAEFTLGRKIQGKPSPQKWRRADILAWEEQGYVVKYSVDSSGSKPCSLSEGIHTSCQKHALRVNEEDVSKSKWFVRGPLSPMGHQSFHQNDVIKPDFSEAITTTSHILGMKMLFVSQDKSKVNFLFQQKKTFISPLALCALSSSQARCKCGFILVCFCARQWQLEPFRGIPPYDSRKCRLRHFTGFQNLNECAENIPWIHQPWIDSEVQSKHLKKGQSYLREIL